MVKLLIVSMSFLVGAAILAAVILSIGVGEIFNVFSKFSPLGIIPLLGFTLAAHIISVVKWQFILRNMGIRVPLIPLAKIYILGYAVSYLTPIAYIGGELFQGQIMKERYGVSFSRAVASVFIGKFLEAFVWISAIFAGAIVLVFHSGISSLSSIIGGSLLSIVFFAGFIAVAYFYVLKRRSLVRILFTKLFKSKNSVIGNFLKEIENEFFVFFAPANKKYILGTLKIAILKYALLWARNVFLIFYLAKVFSFSASITALGFSYLSYMAPVPAAVGAQEGLLSLVFAGLGFEASFGAVLTFLFRGVEIIAVGFGMFFLFKWGFGKFMFRITQWAKSLSPNGKINGNNN